MLRRRPWKVIRGWSPVAASNATTPWLYLSEHLGKDEIRRFRLAQIQIRGVGDVAHAEKAIERLGVIDVSHIHHQTGTLAVWLAEWVAQRRAS